MGSLRVVDSETNAEIGFQWDAGARQDYQANWRSITHKSVASAIKTVSITLCGTVREMIFCNCQPLGLSHRLWNF